MRTAELLPTYLREVQAHWQRNSAVGPNLFENWFKSCQKLLSRSTEGRDFLPYSLKTKI